MEPQQRPNWERDTIEKIALAGIKEQKRTRRWNIFFKFLFFAYLTFIIVTVAMRAKNTTMHDVFGTAYSPAESGHIALVRLDGAIGMGEKANAAKLNNVLRQAMSDSAVKGVLLLANSPGGSPVQSSLVYKQIQSLKTTFNKPIYTAVTDVCASGCYYIVSATDEIYADESSIVGSIGVISQSYGYGEAAKKLGIDPRTFTAGANKDFMNPARPMKPEEEQFLKSLLDELHQNFINAVKAGRKDRLVENAEIFSGLFWTGTKAVQMGLIDGIATPQSVAEKIGNYPVYDYMSQDPLDKVLEKFGAEAGNVVNNVVDKTLLPTQKIEFR